MSTNIFKPTLSSIRLGTTHELADATALATIILSRVANNTDTATYEFSKELFIAVALFTVHTVKNPTFKDVTYCLVHPGWDSVEQMLNNVAQCPEARKQENTELWLKGFDKKISDIPEARLKSIVRRCHAIWIQVHLPKENFSVGAGEKSTGIQVFDQASIGKALEMMCDLKEEKKSGGERILMSAQVNNGYRTVPDGKKACLKLEEAKNQFENLIDPISHLQTNLALAAAMDPAKFRVTPILLLGDPGIGKTYLAMQLAQALGVSMEKMTAGGAQGGFQLTGSHTTFLSARPGLLFKCLAEGKTTSPVFIIDEIDKIRDSQYPVLPVLLDLFDTGSAKCFKDDFFEIEFDASRLIVVLTANSLESVPTPLLSRVEVFDVPRPEPVQRLRIIQGEANQLCLDTNKKIKLDKDTSNILAERMDIDLRKTTRLVREAFTKAMLAGEKVAKLIIPKEAGRRSIGF